MPHCPTCGQQAEHGIYESDSSEFPVGPPIRVCHSDDMAYLHVLEEQQ